MRELLMDLGESSVESWHPSSDLLGEDPVAFALLTLPGRKAFYDGCWGGVVPDREQLHQQMANLYAFCSVVPTPLAAYYAELGALDHRESSWEAALDLALAAGVTYASQWGEGRSAWEAAASHLVVDADHILPREQEIRVRVEVLRGSRGQELIGLVPLRVRGGVSDIGLIQGLHRLLLTSVGGSIGIDLVNLVRAPRFPGAGPVTREAWSSRLLELTRKFSLTGRPLLTPNTEDGRNSSGERVSAWEVVEDANSGPWVGFFPVITFYDGSGRRWSTPQARGLRASARTERQWQRGELHGTIGYIDFSTLYVCNMGEEEASWYRP